MVITQTSSSEAEFNAHCIQTSQKEEIEHKFWIAPRTRYLRQPQGASILYCFQLHEKCELRASCIVRERQFDQAGILGSGAYLTPSVYHPYEPELSLSWQTDSPTYEN